MVSWNIVREIIISWVITIPAAGAVSALVCEILGRIVHPF
jgi:phosphate/sulfate permease